MIDIEQLQKIKEHYAFREETELLRFLHQYPSLTFILEEIQYRIKSYFSEAQLALQFVIDPDADADNLKAIDIDGDLVVSIVTHLPALEAVKLLKNFYMGWWLNTTNQTKN